MNINKLFNKSDIEYSFSLESYINSLNNDYDFNEYKIKVNNKTYNELSIECDRLYNEINKEFIDIDKYNYSTEGIVDKIKDIGKWIVEFIKKIIHHLEVIGKMILAKIYEWTTRDKENLYNKFENSIFKSIDLKIKDKRLNPDLIIDCVKFMSNLNRNLDSFNFNDLDSTEIDILSNKVIDLKEQRENKNFLDNLFYYDKEVKEMTIGEYFGCKAEEYPKQLTILSPEYLKLLKENKNNTDKLIKKLKIFLNELIKDKDKFQDDREKILLIRDNILILYNANYTFFIKSLQVRKKVGKYICKASLEKMLKQCEYSIRKPSEFGRNDTWSELSFYKSIDNIKESVESFLSLLFSHSRKVEIIGSDSDINQRVLIESKIEKGLCLEFNTKLHNNRLFFKIVIDENIISNSGKNIYSTLCQSIKNNSIDTTSIFSKIEDLFEIKFPKYHATIILSPFEERGKYIYGKILYSTYYHKITEEDTIFHSSDTENIHKSISSFFHGKKYTWIKYSEPRIYGGLNVMLSRNFFHQNMFKRIIEKLEREVEYTKNDLREETKITPEMVKNFKVYILDVPVGTIVYNDPEVENIHYFPHNRSIYIPTDKPLRSIDLTPYIREIQEIY